MNDKKILIVDDNIDNLDIIVKFVEDDNEPYELLQALNGNTAFEIAIYELPDLIITDWEMPNMDGIALIKKLKKDKRTVDIPIIMCTGAMLTSEHLKTALQAGAVDYIRKPIDKVELLARIQASLRLSESYKEIKELNNAKDRIFSIISHDLKGPLGSIKSFSDIILRRISDSDEQKIKEMISLIGKQSASAYSILDNLFSWAISQQNLLVFDPKLQKLYPVAADSIDLLNSDAVQKNIELKNNINELTEAYFDTTLVSVVLRNLVANAIKFTNINGEITIEANEKSAEVELSVADNGVGIEADQMKNIFNTNFFHTTFGTNREKGSGLGLKLCKDFVEKSNGKIWVESQISKGSTFYFTVPKH